MDKKHSRKLMFVLGTLEAVALQACTCGSSADSGSAGSPSAVKAVESIEPSEGSAAGQTAGQPGIASDTRLAGIPVRISRSFFERQVAANLSIKYNNDNKSIAELNSSTRWQEFAPTSPAPEGAYLADFRDFQGCSKLTDLGDARLCFTVAPDVSSLDVAEGKMKAEGLESLINEELGAQASADCQLQVSALKFEKAAKSGDGLVTVSFSGQAQGKGCSGVTPISAEVTLKQI